jgi:hypothetical protein
MVHQGWPNVKNQGLYSTPRPALKGQNITAETVFRLSGTAVVIGTTSVFQDFTLLSAFCSFLHHRGITASIFQVNELVLKDAEALGRKDMSFI